MEEEESLETGKKEEAANAPWRRFFARMLDVSLYKLSLDAILILGLKINWLGHSVLFDCLDALLVGGLMLFIEPALLAFFGTTIGKWCMGICITDLNGKRLFYGEGFSRT